MRIRGAGVIAVALTVLAVAGAAPRALDVEQIVQRLQTWLDGTRDLAGRFEQTLTSGALGEGLAESGKLYVLRPGKMRWDYLEPERKVALVDGDRTRLYLEEDEQLWEGRLEDGALLVALLAGDQPLASAFDAALLASPSRRRDGAYKVQLVPRGEAESFQQVVLTLRGPEFAIEAAEVLDGAGNLMRYRFTGLERNAGLPESIFHFEPPPGTEWVRP